MSRADWPAFPQAIAMATGEAPRASYDFVGGAGMSLRDYFAGQALVGICAEGQMTGPAHAAEWAYIHADAMLAERAKAGDREP